MSSIKLMSMEKVMMKLTKTQSIKF